MSRWHTIGTRDDCKQSKQQQAKKTLCLSSIVAGSQKVPHENRVRPTVKLLSAYFSFELSYPLPLPRPALRVETVRRWLTTTLHLWQPYRNLVSFSLKAQSVQILGPTSTHRTKCWLWEHYSPAGLATRGWPPKKLTFGNLNQRTCIMRKTYPFRSKGAEEKIHEGATLS